MSDANVLETPQPDPAPNPATTESASRPASAGEWHRALLRLAGSLPDDRIATARELLAAGDQTAVARTIVDAALESRLAVSKQDAELLSAELAAAGQGTEVVDDLRRHEDDDDLAVTTAWAFSPLRLEDLGDSVEFPLVIDLTTEDADATQLETIDQAAVDAASKEPGVAALWGTWRYNPMNAALLPRHLFIAACQPQVSDDEMPAIAARLQNALSAQGEVDPQVELLPPGFQAPVYQQQARFNAALLWAREPPTALELADVFDLVSLDEAPSFAPDHARIEDADERKRILTYLNAGHAVMVPSMEMDDVFDEDRQGAVPLTIRTDGKWIWCDAMSYYLENYHLSPVGELLAHLAGAPSLPPTVSEVARHRVIAYLQELADDEEDDQDTQFDTASAELSLPASWVSATSTSTPTPATMPVPPT